MQIIKPTTLRLIWEFASRDADFTRGFRSELAEWVRRVRQLYGHRTVREYMLRWARERAARR
jgi:hypothetical protein